MRLDHYMKIGSNDIHLAQLIYSVGAIFALVMSLSLLLGRSIKNDFKNLELVSLRKNERRDQRRRGVAAPDEDEMGLSGGKARSDKTEDVTWKKISD